MKSLLSIFTSFLLFSLCFDAFPFTSHQKIVHGLNKGKLKSKSNVLSEKEVTIIENLMPLDDVIPEKIRKQIDRERKTYSIRKNFRLDGAGVDLRAFDTTIKNQWNGTCTAFGLIASMENFLKGKIHLSERDFWSHYHKYSAKIAIDSAQRQGICEEEYWPQNLRREQSECKKNRVYGLDDTNNYLSGNIQSVIDTLDGGNPVYIAMSTPMEMIACNAFVSEQSDISNGGHALSVVGYKVDSKLKSGGYFIIKNSWDKDCGDEGYQYVDFNFCLKDGSYCSFWAIDNVVKKKLIEPKKCKTYNKKWWQFWKRRKCVEYY